MRVAIVEDEQVLAKNLSEYLADFGFVVEILNDGEIAWDLLVDENFDCVILDVNLPGKNGFEILEHVRKEGVRSPVLMLTARDSEEDTLRGLNAGADDYVRKPFSMAEVKARIHALIRRSHAQTTPTIVLGEITINPLARTVTKGKKEVELTSKEFGILELLARHRGEVVTRTAIFDHVWGSDEDTMSNVIEVYIRNLRKKLGKDVIQTVKGAGYRIM